MTQEQINTLRICRFLRTQREIDSFESTLKEIDAQKTLDQEEVKDLYLLFEDSSAQQDVLWGLLHVIESFDLGVWLPAFVAVLPMLTTQSVEWVDTITSRILNGDKSRPVLKVLLEYAPESRRAIMPILEDLAKEDNPRLQKLRRHAKELMEGMSRQP